MLSRREALVAMVQTTDLGDSDDFPDLGDELRSAIALQRIFSALWGCWERPGQTGLPFY